MLYQPHIRKLLGGLLLLIFIFSSVPRIFLHETFSQHKLVSKTVATDVSSYQDDHSGVNCNCDSVLMQSFFVIADLAIESSIALNFPQQLYLYEADNLFLFSFQQFSLRGPPAA